MAASEYLSKKSEESERNAGRSSLYTGIAYIFTVFLLIFPYLIFKSYFFCLGLTIVTAILIKLVFNFYISVAKDLSFERRFAEMASLKPRDSGALLRNRISHKDHARCRCVAPVSHKSYCAGNGRD